LFEDHQAGGGMAAIHVGSSGWRYSVPGKPVAEGVLP
jgi:hypothetical protein